MLLYFFFAYGLMPRDSVLSGRVFFEALQQEGQIGQSMEYFHPLEAPLNRVLALRKVGL